MPACIGRGYGQQQGILTALGGRCSSNDTWALAFLTMELPRQLVPLQRQKMLHEHHAQSHKATARCKTVKVKLQDFCKAWKHCSSCIARCAGDCKALETQCRSHPLCPMGPQLQKFCKTSKRHRCIPSLGSSWDTSLDISRATSQGMESCTQ